MWNLGLLGASLFIPVGDYELIESAILASTTPSVTFSNLDTYSSTYKHLQIRGVQKTSNGAVWGGSFLRINGDTGSNYRSHNLFGNGSTVSSNDGGSGSSINNPFVAGSTNSSVYSPVVYDILDPYNATKNTTVRFFGGRVVGSGEERLHLSSGLYNNTASVTSLSITGESSTNLLAGSRFSLYGIKG